MPDNELLVAARTGDVDSVRAALDGGANVRASNDDGKTALMQAVAGRHDAIVRLLLDRGANVNQQDRYAWTALLDAARPGHERTVLTLLDRGADINHADASGWTALMVTSEHAHDSIVRLLLDRGADVNHANGRGWTALLVASSYGSESTARLLLERGADANIITGESETALFVAALENYAPTCDLLARHSSVTTAIRSLRHTDHDITTTRTLLRVLVSSGLAGRVPNEAWGQTVLDLMTDEYVAADRQERTEAVLFACRSPAAALRVRHAEHGGTALHEAVACGYPTIVLTLLLLGAALELTDAQGRTASDLTPDSEAGAATAALLAAWASGEHEAQVRCALAEEALASVVWEVEEDEEVRLPAHRFPPEVARLCTEYIVLSSRG